MNIMIIPDKKDIYSAAAGEYFFSFSFHSEVCRIKRHKSETVFPGRLSKYNNLKVEKYAS
jgi:hypothetical protein